MAITETSRTLSGETIGTSPTYTGNGKPARSFARRLFVAAFGLWQTLICIPWM